MDWYLTDDVQPICYPCAMERLRQGETPLSLYPTQAWMHCNDCDTVFELQGRVYVPRFDKVVVKGE